VRLPRHAEIGHLGQEVVDPARVEQDRGDLLRPAIPSTKRRQASWICASGR